MIESLAEDGLAEFRPGHIADRLRESGRPMLTWEIRGELARLESRRVGLLRQRNRRLPAGQGRPQSRLTPRWPGKNLTPTADDSASSAGELADVPFEDALAELESLVEKMETGDLSLEDSLAAFRTRGEAHPPLSVGAAGLPSSR